MKVQVSPSDEQTRRAFAKRPKQDTWREELIQCLCCMRACVSNCKTVLAKWEAIAVTVYLSGSISFVCYSRREIDRCSVPFVKRYRKWRTGKDYSTHLPCFRTKRYISRYRVERTTTRGSNSVFVFNGIILCMWKWMLKRSCTPLWERANWHAWR